MLPRIWWRYVDDVFAVIDGGKEQQTLTHLNSKYPSVKFTIEFEENDSLPFLDVRISRKIDGTVEFSVYRKPWLIVATNTPCYTPTDSYCPMSHKKAAFHSIVYRLCKLPLNINNFMNEPKRITIPYIPEITNKLKKVFKNTQFWNSSQVAAINCKIYSLALKTKQNFWKNQKYTKFRAANVKKNAPDKRREA